MAGGVVGLQDSGSLLAQFEPQFPGYGQHEGSVANSEDEVEIKHPW